MSPLYELLLLQLIFNNGDVSVFVHQGFSYSQIFAQVKDFELLGYVILDKEASLIELTEAGQHRMQEINKSLGRANSSGWISPLYSQMVSRIKIDDVYLPKRTKPDSSY